ncbi:hypothetical protein S83_051930, partial [Arachis hypogaea]
FAYSRRHNTHQTPPLPASTATPHRLGGTNYQYHHPVKFRRERTRIRATLDETEIGQLSSTPLLVKDDKPSKEVEESVKVFKDAAKTRKVAAEKVLSALSVVEKARAKITGTHLKIYLSVRTRDHDSPDDKSKWECVRKGVCCICCESNIDSLLY